MTQLENNELIVEFSIENKKIVENIPGFQCVWKYPKSQLEHISHYEKRGINDRRKRTGFACKITNIYGLRFGKLVGKKL